MKAIQLTQGYIAIVDDADFDWLSQWSWCVTMMGRPGRKKPYAARAEVGDDGKSRTVLMHRAIAGADSGEVVDHRDRDGLNNRRANLRVCTQGQNVLNRAGNADGKTSRFKGVYWQKDIKRWRAKFGKRYLGTFVSEELAAAAYDAAAIAHDAEFCHLNFGKGDGQCLVS